MRKIMLSALLLLFCTLTGSCRESGAVPLNLGFEIVNGELPEQWQTFGNDEYIVGVDDQIRHGGKFSAFIEAAPGDVSGFKAWAFELPGAYQGRLITLSGYLRTENVADGYAGLWMRIDPDVAFDNMADRGVTGTTPWTRFEITLPLNPSKMTRTVVGGLLVGTGKVWIDDLSVTIDGEPVEKLTSVAPQKIEYAAEQDHQFDAGSGITRIDTDAANVRTLRELGLIWGFLKYYHPAVAAGNYNWDYALFRILPELLAQKDRAGRDALLVAWIEGLGPVTTTAPGDGAGEIKLRPDLGWIDNSGFSDELTAALTKVKNADRSDTHYYIEQTPYVRNPVFLHEDPYESMKYPDAGYRLLALYRYWNMIQYFYPNRELIGEDWKGVLGEFVPRFVEARNEAEYLSASLEVIARIHDTHANLWMQSPVLDSLRGKNYAAPIVRFVEGKAVVTGFYDPQMGEQSGLRIGDVITEVDGRPVARIVEELLPSTPASNYPTQLRDIAANLLRTNRSQLTVRYDRQGVHGEALLGACLSNPHWYHQKNISAYKRLEGDIAYLYPASLKKGEIETLWEQMKDARGLIVDLRCYPSDFIVFSLGMKLMPRPTPFVMFSSGNIYAPGLFSLRQGPPVGIENPDYFKGQVVILVDENTQSQAEYTAMAFRVAPRATVVGSTTAGADGNVSDIVLPGGVRTMISGIGILYPDGGETQRVGIVPDLAASPTVAGITAGRDEVLEKALALISK